MVHLRPLPGAPGWDHRMDAALDRAARDAGSLAEGGVDAILVENYGDVPFHPDRLPPETIAALTAAVLRVRSTVGLPVGVNALRNDAAAALGIAAATGATFIRVNVHTGGMFTDQGWIQGRAAETLRLRERVAPDVAILADVLVKHATPPPGLELAAAADDAWERGRADALIVTGAATGAASSLEDVNAIRRAVPGASLIVGSGVTPETVAEALEAADAVIVGSALEENGVAGNPVDPRRVARLVSAARKA